jgi:hypothetical protein
MADLSRGEGAFISELNKAFALRNEFDSREEFKEEIKIEMIKN